MFELGLEVCKQAVALALRVNSDSCYSCPSYVKPIVRAWAELMHALVRTVQRDVQMMQQ